MSGPDALRQAAAAWPLAPHPWPPPLPPADPGRRARALLLPLARQTQQAWMMAVIPSNADLGDRLSNLAPRVTLRQSTEQPSFKAGKKKLKFAAVLFSRNGQQREEEQGEHGSGPGHAPRAPSSAGTCRDCPRWHCPMGRFGPCSCVGRLHTLWCPAAHRSSRMHPCSPACARGRSAGPHAHASVTGFPLRLRARHSTF